MMAALGSQERTANEFERLVEKAGLRILETYTYTWPVTNAVMVLVPARKVGYEGTAKKEDSLRKEEEVGADISKLEISAGQGSY